jgi:tetratricopeptide (TPR) repeat protein
VFVVLAATTAMVVVLYFFFPRICLWRALDWDLPETNVALELNRGKAAWKQVQSPFEPIRDASNRPLQWRLFFPLVAHYLHLPRWAFFLFPWLGCWAVAALTAYVFLRETNDRVLAWLGTTTTLACDWFFTSTGWLGYNDAWTVFGLLAATFLRPRLALFGCCLITPWIDERFFFALPTALLLRRLIFVNERRPLLDLLFDALVAAGGMAPYALIRWQAIQSGRDIAAQGGFADMFYLLGGNLWIVLEGAWMGLRILWVGVLLGVVAAWQSGRRLETVALLAVTAPFFLATLFIAGDLSRSAATFAPVGVAGFVLAHRAFPRLVSRLMPWAAVAACLLPAVHVVEAFQNNIYGFFDEVHHLWNPAEHSVDYQYYQELGVHLAAAGALDEALKAFDKSIELNPRLKISRFNRIAVLVTQGKLDTALDAANELLRMEPRYDEALAARGLIYERKNQLRYALSDYENALKRAPPDWHQRADIEARVKRLRAHGFPAEPPPS